MKHLRLSTPADVPALRDLWVLAFGDGGDYLDNFFQVYYRPERMLVLEEDGLIRAMTAWFDTAFLVPSQGEYRAAYLYAVATHPSCRGKGLAGELLAWADDHFRDLGIPAVTTVPAQPSLHKFFGANGFRECFVLEEAERVFDTVPAEEILRSVSPGEYGAVREALLSHLPHIAYPEDALAYQAGCCRLSGGGLYRGDTPAGPVCLCAEGAGDGLMIVKECLGRPEARELALPDLARVAPARRWRVRTPLERGESWRFAMLKWLGKEGVSWDWASTAYLGLAFD